MNYKQMTTEELVKFIARKYDANEDYEAAWKELVSRVGNERAERLIDMA